jgi:hypothetical protein
MKHGLLIAIGLLVNAGAAWTQQVCGTDLWREQALNDPAVRARQAAFEADVYQATMQQMSSAKADDADATMVLPIVFHIVHENGPENLPDSEIQACVADLNAYFSATFPGPNSGSAATGIQFCLASRDDWGRPSNGIEHHFDTMRTVCLLESEFQEMSRAYYWPTADVINVYVLKSMGGVIGIGSFPFQAEGQPTDGVYMDYAYCGRDASKNTVLAHELGHYLGLFHTFQGGCKNHDCLMQGDLICDTPPDRGDPVFEGCSATTNSCATDSIALNPQNPFRRDALDQNHNFMDYIQTECMELFTPGQRTRMRISIEKWRSSLLRSQYCDGTRLAEAGIHAFSPDDFLVCEDEKRFRVQVVNNGLHYLEDLEISFWINDLPRQSFHWEGGVLPTGYSWITLPLLRDIPAGKNTLHVKIADPNGLSDPFPANDSASLVFYKPGDPARLPYLADFEEGIEEGWCAIDNQLASWQAVETSGCDSVGSNGAITLTPPYLGVVRNTWLISRWIDLQDTAFPYLSIDYAYRRKAGQQTVSTIKVFVMTECDTLAVEELLYKSHNQMSGPFHTDSLRPWLPESCSDWRNLRMALPTWIGSRIMVAIATNISYEHNQRIYFDNIRISSAEADASALAGPGAEDVLLFPVPNDGRFVLEFPALEVRKVKMRIFNSIGQLLHQVDEETGKSRYSHTFDLRGLPSGVYHLELRVGADEPIRKKFLVYAE